MSRKRSEDGRRAMIEEEEYMKIEGEGIGDRERRKKNKGGREGFRGKAEKVRK